MQSDLDVYRISCWLVDCYEMDWLVGYVEKWLVGAGIGGLVGYIGNW